MAQEMLKICNSELEFTTPGTKNILQYLGLDQPVNQVAPNICLDDNDDSEKQRCKR